MINNISYVSDIGSNAGMRLSLGEYSTTTKTLRFWVYHTRMETVNEKVDGVVTSKVIDRILKVRETDTSDYKEYLKLAEEIEFVDLDWDKRWVTTKAKFKAKKTVDNYKHFKLSELKEKIG